MFIRILHTIRILIFDCFLIPDYHHEVYKVSEFSNDVNGEAKETQPIFLGRFLCQLISQQKKSGHLQLGEKIRGDCASMGNVCHCLMYDILCKTFYFTDCQYIPY